MGVKHLWTFLSPVKKEVTIESLNGQIIAVDLSIWIMEAQTHLPKHVAKPHLRHLFFRVNHLLQFGIIPLIVVEGVPPDLKQDTMRNRLGSVNGGKVKRSRFNALHRECCEMLECMGLPYIQAAGEAEAMCAYMNAEGLVDGCITNDGDAFLYGARMVYRNFSIDKKDPHMEAYDAKEIKEKLKLSKETLVGLAVLCGCDYLPKGVEGCGKETIRKFLETLNGDSLIERFNKWAAMDRNLLNYKSLALPGFDNIELVICKKALAHPDFPFKKVISEFLVNRNKIPSVRREWSRPNLIRLVRFAHEKIEWPEEYTASKVIPLLTLYDMKQIINQSNHQVAPSENAVKPKLIVKSRTRQSEPIYEVQWHKLDYDIYTKDEFYVTFEDQKLFQLAFPLLVEQYEASKGQKQKTLLASKRSTKTQSTKKDISKDLSGLDELLNNVVISEKKVTTKQVKVKEVPNIQRKWRNEPARESKENDINHVLENYVIKSSSKEQSDKSLCEYVPLKERLKLQISQKDIGCHKKKVIKSNSKESLTPETPTRLSYVPSPPPNGADANQTSHLSTSLDKDAFGNFEIETSLLDFSIYQTPMAAQMHKSILTPQHKIEIIMTPAKPQDKFRQFLNDSFEVELPLLERLKLKMGKS